MHMNKVVVLALRGRALDRIYWNQDTMSDTALHTDWDTTRTSNGERWYQRATSHPAFIAHLALVRLLFDTVCLSVSFLGPENSQ